MKKTPSRTSPRGSTRGCLCPDGQTYSVECCDGSIGAQGVGSIYNLYDFITTEGGANLQTEGYKNITEQ